MNIAGEVNLLTTYADKSLWKNADVRLCCAVIERILQAPATETSWQALLELFGSWQDIVDVQTWVADLEPKINHWPWSMRHSSLGQRHSQGDKQVVNRLVGHLHIRNIDDSNGSKLQRWSQSPHWCNLQGLTLYKVETQAKNLIRFFNSPYLAQLQRLELRILDSLQGGLGGIFNHPMPHLHILQLIGIGLNTQDFSELQHSAVSHQLTGLDLTGNFIYQEDLTSLLSDSAFPKLEWLSVGDTELNADNIQYALKNLQHPSLKRLLFPYTPAAKKLGRDMLTTIPTPM